MVAPSVAPGRLEQVRSFLNTWRLPNDTRSPQDRLPHLVADAPAWSALLPDVPPAAPGDLPELTQLRSALRTALARPAPQEVNVWLERHPVLAAVGAAEPVVHLPRDPGPVPALLAVVVDAVAQRHWTRLKACPDCRHVFYDHSRNRTRTWCGMYAETPTGRACGSIAKARAYRDRQRATEG